VRSLLVELVRRAMTDEPEWFIDRSLCADSIGKRFECVVL
jgi:hypothetical protein